MGNTDDPQEDPPAYCFHLRRAPGIEGCRADLLLEFLKSVDIDYLFLVGDIVDLWAMRKTSSGRRRHNNVLRIVLSKAKKGNARHLHPRQSR
jgi:UDP-2,3-diacylglucosamine pyrophosphatase LpxH